MRAASPIAPFDDPSVELSARRTGMSFHRTRMSADRTLMSVIRTSLALISFGFTIFEFFSRLEESGVITKLQAPRNFGAALVYLGVGMICAGIIFHVQYMRALRRIRAQLIEEGLVHGETSFPISLTLVVALLLLALGIWVIVSFFMSRGPFG